MGVLLTKKWFKKQHSPLRRKRRRKPQQSGGAEMNEKMRGLVGLRGSLWEVQEAWKELKISNQVEIIKSKLWDNMEDLCTSTADWITVVPSTDSACRWISWQVPVIRERRLTTGSLPALARSSPASASTHTATRTSTQAADKTRTMMTRPSAQPRCERRGEKRKKSHKGARAGWRCSFRKSKT